MKHAKWIVLAVVVLALTLPAVSGESGHKCTMDTQACLNKMVEKMKDRGWVGIEMDDAEDGKTLVITRVVPGSPAEAAGFQVGDALLAVNGARFADNTEEKCVTCEATKENWSPGTTVNYLVLRNGEKAKVSPTLAEVPPDVLAAWVGHHMIEHAEVTDIAKN